MKAEAIVFDKDGTLIDFDAFWVTVSIFAIKDILKELGREDIPIEELLGVLGVKDGVTDIDGILCKGTYEQMGLAVRGILTAHGCDISEKSTVRAVIDAYGRNASKGEVKGTCENIAEVLAKLKARGVKLFVVTTDNYKITRMCLEALGIAKYFDKIYTDDGITPVKPDPYCVSDIVEITGIDTEKIVMVGDTMTDVHFARNAGISVIGVGASETGRVRLAEYADAVIPDISHIFEVIGGVNNDVYRYFRRHYMGS